MQNNYKFLRISTLYIFFILSVPFKIFFSTTFSYALDLDIQNIEISKPFEINFKKTEAIDEGFIVAFENLISKITISSDQEKIRNIPLSDIKSMVNMFSVREEKFIENNYYVSLDVSFNKYEVFSFLEKKNIFPASPASKKLFLMPILIDENDVFIFSNNIFYKNWNLKRDDFELLEYILPSEDLEDIQLIKKNSLNLEKYDFKEIINKYSIDDYIIILIFKDRDSFKILSKINFSENELIDHQKLENIKLEKNLEFEKIIDKLKIIYEDYWKKNNLINTSIKLPLTISLNVNDNKKINEFEKSLSELDLISYFSIYKFNNQEIFYKIIFNGSPKKFLTEMKNIGYEFDTQRKIWNLK